MNLSEIKYKDLLKANNEDLAKIVFENNPRLVTEKCDYGIIFGGISMIPYRVMGGLKLYNEGYLDKILLTGGVGYLNKDCTQIEAEVMRDYLRKNGVPDSDIIVEGKSKNTFQNVFMSICKIEECSNPYEAKIALITSDFHLKRCFLLMQKFLYGEIKNLYEYGVRDKITSIDKFKETKEGKRIILKEAISLLTLQKLKNIPDITIEGLNLTRKK